MRDEYATLSDLDKARVDAVIADARRKRQRTVTRYGSIEYYAYPHPDGGTAWGINGGRYEFNSKRGIR